MRATVKVENKNKFPNTVVTRAWCNYPGGASDGSCPDSRNWPCETCDHCMATVSDGSNPVVKTATEIAMNRWRYFVNKGKVYGIDY